MFDDGDETMDAPPRSTGKRASSSSGGFLLRTPPVISRHYETPPTRRLNYNAEDETPRKLARGNDDSDISLGDGPNFGALNMSNSIINNSIINNSKLSNDSIVEDDDIVAYEEGDDVCSSPFIFTPVENETRLGSGFLIPPDSPRGIMRINSVGSVENAAMYDVEEITPDTPERVLRRSDSLADPKVLEPTLQRTKSVFLFENHFKFVSVIGRGSFSEVFKVCHHLTGQYYAVKKSRRMIRGRNDRKQQLREYENVTSLPEHPNIVKYLRAWQYEQYFFLQMELCDGGSLRSVGKHGPIPMLNLLHYMRDVLSGLSVIHSHRIVHLDLKPDNILWSNEDKCLKIADFGLAVRVEEWDEQEGDKIYMAKEVLEEKISPACDIFSCGLMFWELLTFQSPPRSGDDWMTLRTTGNLPFPPQLGVDPSLAHLLITMVSPDPSMRPSAMECLHTKILQAVLQYPRPF